MSIATVFSRAQRGIDAPSVRVEVHLGPGLPSLGIVGLPETSVRESKDRVRAALNDAGFVRVGATLQSVSHPNVLAAGDIIARDDVSHPRSGVYAVRAGPVLAANLRALVGGGTLVPYPPQQRSLNLLALGDGRAIASWGGWSMQGRLMGAWKDRIDRAFIARFAALAR